MPPGAGNNTLLAKLSRSAVHPGNSPCHAMAIFAGSDSTTSASPRLQALTICRAARLALMEMMGRASVILNHAYSASYRPLKVAFGGLPVRIKPGHTVVTTMLFFASSARNPSDNLTNANLLALYGRRWGR